MLFKGLRFDQLVAFDRKSSQTGLSDDVLDGSDGLAQTWKIRTVQVARLVLPTRTGYPFVMTAWRLVVVNLSIKIPIRYAHPADLVYFLRQIRSAT